MRSGRFLPLLTAVVVVAATTMGARGGVTIDIRTSEGAMNFDPGGFFTSHPQAMTALNTAASFFESILQDDLDAIMPAFSNDPNEFADPNDAPGNIWAAIFNDPGTGTETRIAGLTIPADTLVVYAGARNLGGSTLGFGGPGGSEAIGSGAFLDSVFTRGETGANGMPPTDFGPWGGSIVFDTTTSGGAARDWHFDTLTDPSSGQDDFFSVALHELGHMLGIGTADSWDALVNMADEFTGAASVAEFGANVPLDAEASHWAQGTMSQVFFNGAVQEAAMDPDLAVGTRKLFTDLDVAALDDIGWDIAPQEGGGGNAVPEPGSMALMGLAGMASVVVRRRRRRAA